MIFKLPRFPRPPSLDKFPEEDRKWVFASVMTCTTVIVVSAIVCGHLLAAVLGWAWLAR